MTGAGRNIRVTDETESRDDIARLYGEEHGDVWDLLRRMGLAAEMRPPIFKVHALVARVGEHIFQSRGRAMVEQGWLTVFPKEDARLERQLPEDPSVLNELAQESSGHDIAAVDVVRDTRQWREQVLTPAALIALMKEKGIGRPSTYARHVERLREAVDQGLVKMDENDGFHITDTGLSLLRCLDMDDLPSLDVAYSAKFEAQLKAIERGELAATDVLRTHLGMLPGVRVDIAKDDALSVESVGPRPTPSRRGSAPKRVALPAALDPDAVLHQDHPLRAVRRNFEATQQAIYGAGALERVESGRLRVCRAGAIARLLGDWPLAVVIERLRLDVGLRWVVGLDATDVVWTEAVLEGRLEGESELVGELCAAVDKGTADAFRRVVTGQSVGAPGQSED